jgi:hypothetical protein
METEGAMSHCEIGISTAGNRRHHSFLTVFLLVSNIVNDFISLFTSFIWTNLPFETKRTKDSLSKMMNCGFVVLVIVLF